MIIRPIEETDNAALAVIIRKNLKAKGLDIPGTVYYDDATDHLSDFYTSDPQHCGYFTLLDDEGRVCGGAGFAVFDFFDSCVELQKIYLDDSIKGKGCGKMMLKYVEDHVRKLGYQLMYLETHHALDTAVKMYTKYGYHPIERPSVVQHGSMDTFMVKEL